MQNSHTKFSHFTTAKASNNLAFGSWPAWPKPQQLFEEEPKKQIQYGNLDIHAGQPVPWMIRISIALILGNSLLSAVLLPQMLVLGVSFLLAFFAFWHLFLIIVAPMRSETGNNMATTISADLRAMDPKFLPCITLLCPVYQEAQSLHGLIAALSRLNWPKSRLQLLIVAEEGDAPTLAVAKLYAKHDWIELSVTPNGPLKTKPSALNHAIYQAKGEIVGIYDVEDRPDSEQLMEMFHYFVTQNCAAIQAPLKVETCHNNWITQQFADEYAIHFRLCLRAKQRLDLPIALGGTSCFFRKHDLENLRGWDGYNVTEDADLGYRLHFSGRRTICTDLPTLETMPGQFGPWCRQRSRWLKGFMQTSIALARRQFSGHDAAHPVAFIAAQLHLLGAIGSAALFFPLALLSLCLLTAGVWNASPLLLLCLIPILSRAIGLLKIGQPKDLLRLWVTPFYWLFHCAAFWLALYDFCFKPYHWRKTAHAPCKANLELMNEPSPIQSHADDTGGRKHVHAAQYWAIQPQSRPAETATNPVDWSVHHKLPDHLADAAQSADTARLFKLALGACPTKRIYGRIS